MCVDSRDRTYEYGEFKRTRTFDDCADVCVKDVPSSLLSSFRGIDFDCKEETCRCLYDSGTLSTRNSGRFDRTSTRERGDGSIASTTRKRDFYCGSLVGMMEENEEEEEFTAAVE